MKDSVKIELPRNMLWVGVERQELTEVYGDIT